MSIRKLSDKVQFQNTERDLGPVTTRRPGDSRPTTIKKIEKKILKNKL